MNAKLLLLLIALPLPGFAQGFAGLGTQAEGFAIPWQGYSFDFPADHGPHPDFRIEWWYLTANLEGANGERYGVQWTLFRSALAPGEAEGWTSPQIWMGHAGLTTGNQHYSAERLARGGIGQAGVTAEPFAAWIDDWEMAGPDMDRLSLSANDEDFGYNLTLEAQGPLVFQGDQGYSVKSPEGQASYYYSQPFYSVAGTLRLPSGDIAVTGQGWLDREWSSQPLSETQDGWDWVSLSFTDGSRLMGFRLRDRAGPDFYSGTWIDADGAATPFRRITMEPVVTTPVRERDIPTSWRIVLPERDVTVEITALNPQAWMDTSFPYWEGPVRVTGSHEGWGYLEMTGY